MQQNYIESSYEITSISRSLVLVKCIKSIYLGKVNSICKQILKRTKKSVVWFNNLDAGEIEIYTENDNLREVKDALKEIEAEYNSILAKRRMIIAHRHRKE